MNRLNFYYSRLLTGLYLNSYYFLDVTKDGG